MKKETTYGASSEGLSRLLPIGVEKPHAGENPGSDPTPAELLQKILTDKLPLDPAVPHSLPAVLKWPGHELLAASGHTMAHLLLSSETDLAVIKTIKDYGKELVRRGASDCERAAGTAIYFAAIASALVFHQERITQHSNEKLHEAFSKLQQKPWIPSELGNLFQWAREKCDQQKGKLETKGGNHE